MKSRSKGGFFSRVKTPVRGSWSAWYDSKSYLFHFCFKFCAIIAFSYLLSATVPYQSIGSFLVRVDANLSKIILNTLGEKADLKHSTLFSEHHAVLAILPACTALDVSWYLVAAIAAFPASLKEKIIGIFAGVLAIFIINEVRILTLYLSGVYWPSLFETLHEDIWSFLMNTLIVFLVTVWIFWTKNRQRRAVQVR